jgi:predicted PurR-regulated permease PerM
MPETKFESRPLTSAAAASLRIIAVATVFACLYVASSLVISLICGIFIAIILEPGVTMMERLRVPRWVGSLVMVVATLAVMYLVIYLIYGRAAAFMADLPNYATRLKNIIAQVQVTFRNIRLSASSLLPPSNDIGPQPQAFQLQQETPWLQFLWGGLSSAYGFVMAVLFIPILVFFMLTSKHQIWVATMNLFPMERRNVVDSTIGGITLMARQYVLGNILIALISAAVICPVFWLIDLPYALLLGSLAAFLSMVPYLGIALGMMPPLLVALVHPEYKEVFPFIVIAVTVAVVHFAALNILTPKLVGHRVNLNALTVTISLMFWGWLWGGIGLVLAIPITAAIKAICDNNSSLRPYGAWMGED